MPAATDLGADIYRIATEMFKALPGKRPRYRLLGVQASGLIAAGAQQLAMLEGRRWGDVERTLDAIERRFGTGAAKPATLLDRGR
jgi:hypothetical protein